MLVELYVGNCATSNGFINGANGIFKTSIIHIVKKSFIWILFQNFKIGTLTREIYSHYYDNNIESKWTPIESIIKDVKVDKSQSFIITRIQFSNQLVIEKPSIIFKDYH
jgi:hypothetical protein